MLILNVILSDMVKRRPYSLSYFYAWFLVFITPITVPLAIWTWYEGWVTKEVLICTLVMYCISGLGITLGYHRLVTHRAFQTTPLLRRLFMIAGTFAMQGGPASWASLHIQHHRFSDKPGDPHSPEVGGFWFAHCGWIFHEHRPNFRRYGKWLLKDKAIKHISKNYLGYSILGLIIPTLWCGWMGLLWGGFLRVFLCIHVTWCVNSICHWWGTRDYPTTPDTSRNNALVALVSFGEGWHNNHHRFMQMPFFGHKWYQIDMGKWLLVTLKLFGLVWDLKVPKDLRPTPRLQEEV